MPLTNFPQGLSSFGIPMLGPNIPTMSGKYFFVNSATGLDNNNRGSSPDAPFKTLAYAITKCTSGRGDVIVIASGHAEDVIAAGTITLNKNNVTIVGLGNAGSRPVFTFKTVVGATILVSGTGVTIQNVIYDLTGITGITTGVNVTGVDCSLLDSRFVLSSAGAQATQAVTVAAARLTVQRCHFTSPNAGPVAAIKGIAAVDDVRVYDCRFTGNYSTAAINNTTAAWTNVDLRRSSFYISSATGIGIALLAAATGVIADNYTYVTANIAAGGSISAAAAALFNNQGMELAHAGASAQLDPVAGGFA